MKKVSPKEFLAYIEDCKNKGFTIDAEKSMTIVYTNSIGTTKTFTTNGLFAKRNRIACLKLLKTVRFFLLEQPQKIHIRQ